MFGDRIVELRKEYKVSQEQLAEIMSTTRQAISKWERGESYPDLDRLKDLAIYFNVSIDYLLDYDIESTSVKNFSARLEKASKDKKFDITEDEIKLVISKNNNNFELLIKAIAYLIRYDFANKTKELSDLVLVYAKRALELYPNNKTKEVKEMDFHSAIIMYYTSRKRFEEAKEYIVNNHISGIDDELAAIEFELGNYGEASRLLSDCFITSIQSIINTNVNQFRLFVKKNQIHDLYDLCNFDISLIKSIGKKEDFFIDIVYLFTAVKAVCEYHLGMNYENSIKYLIDNYSKTNKYADNSDSIKFYYNDRFDFLVSLSDLKQLFKEEIDNNFSGTELEDASKFVYNKVFGE